MQIQLQLTMYEYFSLMKIPTKIFNWRLLKDIFR